MSEDEKTEIYFGSIVKVDLDDINDIDEIDFIEVENLAYGQYLL